MKKYTMPFLVALGLLVLQFGAIVHLANSQVQPQNYVQTFYLGKALTAASGTTTAVTNASAPKEYQLSASVASGTGTAVVTIQGSNDGVAWDNAITMTLSTSTSLASTSTYSNDRYASLRATYSQSGSTPTFSLTGAY